MTWFNLFKSTQHREPRLVMFPTYCTRSEQGDWQIDIHGWVYYPHSETKIGRAIRNLLQRKLGLEQDDERMPVFLERAAGFSVEHSRKAQVRVHIAGQDIIVPRTKRNGHFRCTIHMPDDIVLPLLAMGNHGEKYISYSANVEGWNLFEIGQIIFVPNNGVSVISDLDDTIKNSHVANKNELLANTFTRELKPVTGMSELYQNWQKENILFHYISASPWQLFPMVQGFLKHESFPNGSIHLRKFALKDITILKKLSPSHKGKRKVIEDLLLRCPQRKFILVGDSGEKDPEMYADVARKFPKQISRIFIRNVTNEKPETQRFKKAFHNIPSETWEFFESGETLPRKL